MLSADGNEVLETTGDSALEGTCPATELGDEAEGTDTGALMTTDNACEPWAIDRVAEAGGTEAPGREGEAT